MKDWDEGRLEQELAAVSDEMPDAAELEKRIRRSMTKRIIRLVLRVLAAVTAAAVLVFFAVSPLMNRTYPDPAAMQEDGTLLRVLRSYMEVTRPYREIIGLEVSSRGFAQYDLTMQVADQTQQLILGKNNVSVRMVRGQYEGLDDPEGLMVQVVNRFGKAGTADDALFEKLKGLPASAVVWLSVTAAVPMDYEDLAAQDISLDWMQVYQPETDFQGGISLCLSAMMTETDDRRNMGEAELLDVYRDNLNWMLTYMEWWQTFGLSDGQGSAWFQRKEPLAETYENALELTELQARSFSIHGSAEQILHFLETVPCDSVYVESVSLW